MGKKAYFLKNLATTVVKGNSRKDDSNNMNSPLAFTSDAFNSLKGDSYSLDETLTQLKKFVNTANAPIFMVDMEGYVNEWNLKATEVTGYSRDEALGKHLVSSFIDRSLRKSVQAIISSALEGNDTSNFSLDFLTKKCEKRCLLLNASSRRDSDNTIIGVVILAQDITQATLHDKAVAAAAFELRLLVDKANAPIFGIDPHGKINEWNEKTAEITGFSREEVLGKPLVATFIPPRSMEEVDNVMKRALQGEQTSNYEIDIITKQNEIRHVLVNTTTRRDHLNNIIGVVGVAQDVTEKSKHDRVVAGMASELRQLIETANAPIIVLDTNGFINEWNDKSTEVTGYSRNEAIGKQLVSFLVTPNMLREVDLVMKRALLGEQTSNYEVDIYSKSKEIRHVIINTTTRRDHANNITGIVVVAQDVTEKSKHDRVVAGMASELRQLIEKANAPIFGCDKYGNVNEWNEKTAEITGYSKEEAFNRPLVETFIVSKLRNSVKAVLDDALRGKETANYELEFHTKTNEVRYLLLNATTRRDPENNIVGVIGVAQDVTAAAQRERAVLSMARELRQFVDKANAPIFGIDIHGKVNEWNDKTVEITGFSKDEAFDKPLVSTFIVPSFRHSVQVVLDNALKGVETSNYELEFHTKSNEIRYLLMNATTRRNAENKVIGVIGVAQDVTEASKHDKAVAAMGNELRQFVDTANAPIFGIDVDGAVNEWNEKTAEITGFSKDEAFDKPLVETFIVPSLRQSVQEVMDNALRGDETANYQLEFRTKSNEIRHLLVNATTRRDAENNVVGVVGVAQDVTETAKHDRAVAAMANELRQLIDTANAPIFGIDISGNVNEWNDKTAEITGFSKEEAFNYPLVDTFIVPKLRDSVQEVLDNALEGKETSNYELEFRTKSDEVRYLLVNATTRRDPENRIVGVVGVAQDVTEAAERDRAVSAMANELRQLIETANAPIFGIDKYGNVNEWNEKTAEITGFSKEEAFDRPLVETFIVPSFRHSVEEVMDNALKGRGTANYQLEFRTKSNEIRYLLVNATTRRDPSNNIVGVLGVAQDVTEAANHDRAVAAMANELRQLIDTANAPIFGIDEEGRVNEWNDKTAEITGFSKEEALDYPLVSKFIVPKLRKKVQEILDDALKGVETSNYELEFRTKSKETRYLLVNATTRRDPDGIVVGVVGVAQDVTDDRKHSEELREMQYLRASQEAKVETERNMTAYFAHELRNPLHAIDSALNSMPQDLPEVAQSLINAMQLCASFMSTIMNNLLDVRKMEEGKMTLNLAPLSLKALMSGCHKMLGPSVRPGVEFIVKCDTRRRDWVLADFHRIQQVLTNVITNAIKYTTSGSISLIVSWDEQYTVFECRDTGPGIPLAEQKRLFERFVQRGGAPGTGLGLAIAKHLVDLMKGSIAFISDPSVRPGTSCIVKVPLAECKAPKKDDKAQKKGIIKEKLSFLVIDDVSMNRMMLSRRIKKGIAPNSVITEASTGEEALAICGKEKFDVIVVDQYMEQAGGIMVGTDVVFAMRRMRIDSIIIGCSGNDIDDLFKEAGTDWVWGKPMPSNSVILEQLQRALRDRAK